MQIIKEAWVNKSPEFRVLDFVFVLLFILLISVVFLFIGRTYQEESVYPEVISAWDEVKYYGDPRITEFDIAGEEEDLYLFQIPVKGEKQRDLLLILLGVEYEN